MSHNPIMPQTKHISSNPLAQFAAQFPDAGAGKKARLVELCNQKEALKKQSREIQTQTKIISRKIGEAKKNNQPATELIESMQTHSKQSRQLQAELKKVEANIQDFFSPGDDKDLAKTSSAEVDIDRRYCVTEDSPAKLSIELLVKEDNAWNEYVAGHPAATIHHLIQWRDILKKSYGIESFYFLARDDRRQVVGVLPLVRLKSRLFGDMLVSMPYFQRGGAIADHPSIETALMQAANEEAARLGIKHIEYRDEIPRETLPAQSNKVNMVLTLPGSEAALWNGFTAKLRAQIKRPQQLAPQVLIGGKEYLDDFYKVYSHNMRDLGSPAHSRLLLENMLEAFPGKSWIIVIRLNNTPVSAGFLLGHGDTMEIPLASTIRKANPHSMNMLLYWEVLQFAISEGYRYFDFGRSTKDAGTYRFKKQWGAQPKPLYWHYWLNAGAELPALNPSNPKFSLAIRLWKRLPVTVSQWLGPHIVKNIP